MLSNPEKMQLRQLVQSPQWGTMERLANMLCDKMKEESAVKDTEWDTLKTTLLNEGIIRGIKSLVKEVYENIQSIEQ